MTPDDYTKAKYLRDKDRDVDLSRSNYKKAVGAINKFANNKNNSNNWTISILLIALKSGYSQYLSLSLNSKIIWCWLAYSINNLTISILL